MSDWKSRAKIISSDEPSSDWKSRAIPVKQEDPGSLHDLGIGVAQGVTVNSGDEILAGGQTLKDILMGDSDISDARKTWRTHQKENEADVDSAKARSPYLVGGGELAGGLLTAYLTRGKSGAAGAPIAPQTLGQLAIQHGLKGGLFGGVSGFNGSHGDVDSLDGAGELFKDTAIGTGVGSVIGGAVPLIKPLGTAALSSGVQLGAKGALGLGKTGLNILNKVTPEFVEDKLAKSPYLEKLKFILEKTRDGSQEFSGLPAGADIQRQLQTKTESLTNQLTNPIDEVGEYYGKALTEAGDAGSRMSNTNSDYVGSIKNLIPHLGKPKFGEEKTLLDLLTKHSDSKYNHMSMNQVNTSLTPMEGKTAQNLARSLYDPTNKDPSNLALKYFIDSSKGALDETLPEGMLTDINTRFGAPRDIINTVISKGELNPEFQLKHISDLDPTKLSPTIKTYLQNNLIPHLEDSNIQGDKAKSVLSNILEKIKTVNESGQTQYVDPVQFQNEAKDIGMKFGIRADIGGKNGGTQNLDAASGILSLIKGKSLQATEYVGQGIRKLDSLAAGKALYQAPDAEVEPLVKMLNDKGFTDIARHLNNALLSGDANKKKAALFTIMTNPNYKQVLETTGKEIK